MTSGAGGYGYRSSSPTGRFTVRRLPVRFFFRGAPRSEVSICSSPPSSSGCLSVWAPTCSHARQVAAHLAFAERAQRVHTEITARLSFAVGGSRRRSRVSSRSRAA